MRNGRVSGVRTSRQAAASGEREALESALKTQGEIEAAVCEGVRRFEQDYMGRGPKDIHAHLIGDLLVVRLKGVLTAAEQQLVKSLPAEKGRTLLKQVRTHLIETARPLSEVLIRDVAGVSVVSLHHNRRRGRSLQSGRATLVPPGEEQIARMERQMPGLDGFETAVAFEGKRRRLINDEICRKTKRTATVIRRGLGEE